MIKCKAQNASFFREPMKQNSAYVLLMKGLLCNEHTEYIGIALSSTNFLGFEVS